MSTIVIPVYNEEESIIPLHQEILKIVADVTSCDFEVLFVDDGSTDNTLKKITQCSSEKLPVGYVKLSKNFGHQAALEAGICHASGDIVITMDGDMEHPPSLIPAMIDEYLKGADIVQMQRTNTGRDSKGVISVLFYSFFKKVSDKPVVPNAADFRLISRQAVEEIKKMSGKGKVLRALIPAIGFNQVLLPYAQPKRKFGKPKYTFFASYELAIQTLFKFTTFPAHALLFTGTNLLACGIVLLALVMTKAIQVGILILSLTLLLCLGGMVLLIGGILCWYLYFILEQVRSNPTYIVSKVVTPKHTTEQPS